MSKKKKGCSTVVEFMQNREYHLGHFSVNCLMRGRLKRAQNLYRKDLFSHYGCVNAIEFSHDGQWLVSGGDDRRILIWNVAKSLTENTTPTTMKGEHGSNIFCLGFDNSCRKIFSAGNDEQVIVHDFETGTTLDVFLHQEAVYGLTIDPLNDNVFASACEDGRVLIYDIREPSSTDPFCLAYSTSAFHAVMFNPLEPRLLATANSKEGVSLWDIRNPKKSCLLRYGTGTTESCMSVRFNSNGTRVLALRRRLPPILYNFNSSTPLCQFDHKEYYNSCTMKSCCFAGDEDQFVLSGSDDFNLYMWEIPEEGSEENWVEEAHLVLRGHRSIVNQVRFNHSNFLLASSGVEKIIKLWSPFSMPNAAGELALGEKFAKERKVYSHEEYINLILQSGQVMSHDYSHKSTLEDPRMMAFFDSLVQREIEGWNSDTSSNTINTETWLKDNTLVISDSDSSSTLSSDEDFASTNSIVSQSAIAYGLSVVANHLDQDVLGVDDRATEVHDTQGEETVGGSQHANRISQLIAKKRQQLMRAARAKVLRRLNRRRQMHARLARRIKDSLAKNKQRLCTSSDDGSNSDETKHRTEVKKKLAALEGTVTDQRRFLRKRRLISTSNYYSDSDSDMSNNAFGPQNEEMRTLNSTSCVNGESSAKPSTSQENGPSSNLVRYDTNDSSEDEENGDEEDKRENDSATNDKYGNSSMGTPDSGISSNACDNGELTTPNPSTVWTQFKRIRSRLERVCRNYRTHNSD